MNIDLEIVNRAFNKAGEEALTETEIKENQNRWQLIKNFYLATILETLNNTAWTSQTKREILDQIEEDDSGLFVYELPADCAKPIKLRSEIDYTIEGNLIYTSDENPELIYVSNNYTGKYKFEKTLGVTQAMIINYVYTPVQIDRESFVVNTFYIKNENGVYELSEFYDPEDVYYTKETGVVNKTIYVQDEETEEYVLAQEYDPDVQYYTIKEEDYPFYDYFHFDPLLSEYIETKLASKIVLKLSGNQNLYQLLYSEAVRMENTAVKATFAHAHNKDKGNRYWGDILGLPDYGEK